MKERKKKLTQKAKFQIISFFLTLFRIYLTLVSHEAPKTLYARRRKGHVANLASKITIYKRTQSSKITLQHCRVCCESRACGTLFQNHELKYLILVLLKYGIISTKSPHGKIIVYLNRTIQTYKNKKKHALINENPRQCNMKIKYNEVKQNKCTPCVRDLQILSPFF